MKAKMHKKTFFTGMGLGMDNGVKVHEQPYQNYRDVLRTGDATSTEGGYTKGRDLRNAACLNLYGFLSLYA